MYRVSQNESWHRLIWPTVYVLVRILYRPPITTAFIRSICASKTTEAHMEYCCSTATLWVSLAKLGTAWLILLMLTYRAIYGSYSARVPDFAKFIRINLHDLSNYMSRLGRPCRIALSSATRIKSIKSNIFDNTKKQNKQTDENEKITTKCIQKNSKTTC